MDILFQEIIYLFIFLSYLAWTKANSSEFIFHLLNGSFFPQWYSAFWIRRFSICSPKLPIKQTPLQVGRERESKFIYQNLCNEKEIRDWKMECESVLTSTCPVEPYAEYNKMPFSSFPPHLRMAESRKVFFTALCAA